jgi:hypothetical protein
MKGIGFSLSLSESPSCFIALDDNYTIFKYWDCRTGGGTVYDLYNPVPNLEVRELPNKEVRVGNSGCN